MELKSIVALIAIVITVLAPLTYIRDILSGKIKPHAVTWLIWSILVSIGFYGQIAGGGGFASYVLGFTALMNSLIFVLSLKAGLDYISRSDLFLLSGSVIALSVLVITKDPLVSVLLATLVQTGGFIPTIQKTYKNPEQEGLALFSLSVIKQLLGVLSLAQYNVLTLLFPVVTLIMNAFLSSLILVRQDNE